MQELIELERVLAVRRPGRMEQNRVRWDAFKRARARGLSKADADAEARRIFRDWMRAEREARQ